MDHPFDRLSRQDELAAYFASLDRVVAAYLFGSQARGETHALSDVDVGVLVDEAMDAEERFDLRLRVIRDLMALLQTNEVDVVVMNDVPLALNYRILRDGVRLYEGDENARIQFQAATVSRYLDFKPVLERHERALIDRAARGELLDGYNPYRGALADYRRLRERLGGTARSEP